MRRGFGGLIVAAAAASALIAGCAHRFSGTALLGVGDWRAIEINGETVVPGNVTRRPWLHFAVDSGRVTGSGGCNSLSGPFTVDGLSITFGALAMTRMACADARLNAQENAFVSTLSATDHYTIAGDTLTLYSAGVAKMKLGH